MGSPASSSNNAILNGVSYRSSYVGSTNPVRYSYVGGRNYYYAMTPYSYRYGRNTYRYGTGIVIVNRRVPEQHSNPCPTYALTRTERSPVERTRAQVC